jgi:ATP-binding cassette subfamily A (ABC1) protein 3
LAPLFPLQDEADILGDRIAIMAEGQLRCLGSSLFLKKAYGVGYQLTIEKKAKKTIDSDGVDKNGVTSADQQHDVDDKLMEIVKGAVPNASLLSNVGTEMSYQLPLAASAAFTGMFEQLDSEADEGNVVTYGVGVTTLDEVFLLVARGGETNDKKSVRSSLMSSSAKALQGMSAEDAEKSIRSRMELENDGLVLRHIGALFKKRALNFKRDKKVRFIIPLSSVSYCLLRFCLRFCQLLFTIQHRPGAVQRFCQVSLFLLVSSCSELSPPTEIWMHLN